MAELTPMLKQYMEIKEKHDTELLLFRLGDFYELFGEDAKVASRILNIVLTARSKGTANEIPMCGIPHHALNNYLVKLLKAGQRVAICDQVSDPTLPGIVKREVTKVITPGTTIEDASLDDKANNYIVSLFRQKNVWGLAVADLTTGDFSVTEVSDLEMLRNELFRFNASEVIVPAGLLNDTELEDFLKQLSAKGGSAFGGNNVNEFTLPAFEQPIKVLLNHFKVKHLGSFGVDTLKVGIAAAGQLLAYLRDTQKTDLKHITKVKRHSFEEFMVLDEATIRNLELFQTGFTGDYQGSLLSVIDKTVTNLGGRMLRRWLLLPLINEAKIKQRLTAVGEIKKDHTFIKNIIEKLKLMSDLERLLGKIGCGRVNARDLVALKNSLELIPEIKKVLDKTSSELLQKAKTELGEHVELVKLLDEVLLEEPSALVMEGGMVKDGYNEQLDELRIISRGGKEWLLEYQAKEVERTGISTLKVKYNKVFGYYIEISKANSANAPEDYTRKQTLVNAERFITPELKEYEEKILGAEDKINKLEYQIFVETVEKIEKYFTVIQLAAEQVGQLDVLVGFACLANEHDYNEPMIGNSGALKIIGGRHPVIEQFIKERYVPNDLMMDHEQNEFILLTGPNMSGKSSYLRQNALICLLAQIGSFVPAEKAELCIVDRIFTRVGASDNLTQGVSTFMAEMQEAANILNNATDKSLIILDELGRGTSTYDGVSIAWAIMEHIHENIKAKTIFATHYHELTDVVEKLERAENYCVAVSESGGKVVFLHQIIKGASSDSYGIEVAKLAGLPDELINKANEILQALEQRESTAQPRAQQSALPLQLTSEEKAVVKRISDMDVDQMTPLEALQRISNLKKSLDNVL
jgi:DNA mismatch repair protein MutS